MIKFLYNPISLLVNPLLATLVQPSFEMEKQTPVLLLKKSKTESLNMEEVIINTEIIERDLA